MNDMLNRLRAWMQMYDQQGMGGGDSNAYGLNMHPPSRSSLRDEWAQQMLARESQGAPGGDYFDFADERQQAPQGQGVAPIRDVNALRQSLGQGQQPMMRNRLLAYMGGR